MFKNFFLHYSWIATLVVAFLLFYFNSCRKCPTCPEVGTNSSVTIDTIVIHDTVRAEKIRWVKTNPPASDWTNNVQNCDSINQLFNSEFISEVDLSDTIMKGVATLTISQNLITGFSLERTYFIKTDSVIQKVFVPTYKNCFTLGLFGGRSSGVNIGYRFSGKHLSAGYDVVNKGLVFGFNMDLK